MSWRERIAGMIEIVSDLVMDSDGKTASKGADDHELDSQAGWHFGFYSRPKDNARGVVLKADGQGNTSFLICWRDKQYEMTLEKGEVGIQNAFQAKILLDKNGAIVATSKSGQTIQLNGTSYSLLKTETLLTDLQQLMTYLATWVPLVVTGVATVPSGTATDPGVASQASSIATKCGNGSYKSSKVTNG